MAITATINSFAFFSENPIWAEAQSDLVGTEPNLRVKCLVSLSDGISYRTYSCYESVNADNKFLFNLSAQINGILADWYDSPIFSDDFTICQKTPISAEIYFTELYDGTVGDSVSKTAKIIQGGLYLEELDTLTDWWSELEYWVDNDPTRISFLTNKPKNSIWISTAPEFLYYYNKLDNNITLSLQVECFDSTGYSIDLFTKYIENVLIDKVVMINLSKIFTERFTVNPNDGMYRVWLTYSSGIVSEKRSYYIDKKSYNKKHHFTFLNKKGTFDIVTFKGSDQIIGTVEQTIIGKDYEKAQSISTGIKTVIKKQLDRRIKVSSGPLLKAERIWLYEMLSSKNVFEVIDYNPSVPGQSKLLPIIIQNKDLPLVTSSEFSGELQIEYSY
jgi:hypothetical protein